MLIGTSRSCNIIAAQSSAVARPKLAECDAAFAMLPIFSVVVRVIGITDRVSANSRFPLFLNRITFLRIKQRTLNKRRI
jgi:hypothetical protein